MANVLIESQTMTDIADAIREKNGTDTTYKPADMPQAVRDIKSDDTGVGSRQWWLDVCTNKTTFSSMFSSCSSLITIPQIDTSKGTDFNSMFSSCSSLITIPQIDTSKGRIFKYMFTYCSNLTTIPQIETSNGTNFQYMFYGCNNLTTVSQLDTSKSRNLEFMFISCNNLKNISFVAGCIKSSISFAYSPLLSNESLQSIIDGLADLTGKTAQTITLHTAVKSKLTEEQIAMITSKNWTLA